MSNRHIHIGSENAGRGFDRFIDAWQKSVKGEQAPGEVHLNFEDLSMLLEIVTPRRMELLKKLREEGPMSIRALAKVLARDYKNVHTDARTLEAAGLLGRTESGKLMAPWDVIDAHLSLVA